MADLPVIVPQMFCFDDGPVSSPTGSTAERPAVLSRLPLDMGAHALLNRLRDEHRQRDASWRQRCREHERVRAKEAKEYAARQARHTEEMIEMDRRLREPFPATPALAVAPTEPENDQNVEVINVEEVSSEDYGLAGKPIEDVDRGMSLPPPDRATLDMDDEEDEVCIVMS